MRRGDRRVGGGTGDVHWRARVRDRPLGRRPGAHRRAARAPPARPPEPPRPHASGGRPAGIATDVDRAGRVPLCADPDGDLRPDRPTGRGDLERPAPRGFLHDGPEAGGSIYLEPAASGPVVGSALLPPALERASDPPILASLYAQVAFAPGRPIYPGAGTVAGGSAEAGVPGTARSGEPGLRMEDRKQARTGLPGAAGGCREQCAVLRVPRPGHPANRVWQPSRTGSFTRPDAVSSSGSARSGTWRCSSIAPS